MPITDAQRRRRSKCLGSSDVAAILGVDPFANAYDVWMSKTGRMPDEGCQRVMNQIDVDHAIKLMDQLWPKWEPTDSELGLMKSEFKRFDYDVAVTALKQAAFESNYTRPPRKTIRSLMLKLQPKPKAQEQTSNAPEPTTFVIYIGGGGGTLLPGYYFPVCTKLGVDENRAAEQARLNRIELYGGEWRVISEATKGDMIGMRCRLRGIAV